MLLANSFANLGLACSIERYGPDRGSVLRELQLDGHQNK
jgi:hypothetical protein